MDDIYFVRPSTFFRVRLLFNPDPETIQRTLESLKKETTAIRKEVSDICWVMRGGVTWNEAWELTHEERKAISKTVKEAYEKSSKSGDFSSVMG